MAKLAKFPWEIGKFHEKGGGNSRGFFRSGSSTSLCPAVLSRRTLNSWPLLGRTSAPINQDGEFLSGQMRMENVVKTFEVKYGETVQCSDCHDRNTMENRYPKNILHQTWLGSPRLNQWRCYNDSWKMMGKSTPQPIEDELFIRRNSWENVVIFGRLIYHVGFLEAQIFSTHLRPGPPGVSSHGSVGLALRWLNRSCNVASPIWRQKIIAGDFGTFPSGEKMFCRSEKMGQNYGKLWKMMENYGKSPMGQ